MPFELISIQGLWPVLEKFPAATSALLSWYFTEKRLSQLVYVDLFPRNESAQVNVGQVARFDIQLQIINLSPFEIELDRANIRLLVCGTTLEAAILKKEKIASGKSTSLFISGSMPDGHADQLAKVYLANDRSDGTLDGNIEFNCRPRSFARSVGSLSGVQVKVLNAQNRGKSA